MSPQTAETLDRDGFTPAEQAYFASQGQSTEGLLDNDADTTAPDAGAPDPAIDVTPAADAGAAKVADPVADPFDELEKVATDNRNKTGKVIPEANFRAVSEKYKLTKGERDDLKKRLEAVELDAKSAREDAAKEREMRTRIDERLKLFNEVIAPQAAEGDKPAAMPNPEDDIFGAFKWMSERVQDLQGQIAQTGQTLHDTTADTQLRTTYQSDAHRFSRETPDFVDAYNHLNRVRDAMLLEVGYTDPEERARVRMQEERDLVDRTLKAGKSPAATIYGVAKSLGYVKAAPAAQADPAKDAVAAVAKPAAGAAPSVTDEIDRIAKAQAASKSLSSGGGATTGPMTVELLANMSEGEFEAYARKNPNVVKELMGG